MPLPDICYTVGQYMGSAFFPSTHFSFNEIFHGLIHFRRFFPLPFLVAPENPYAGRPLESCSIGFTDTLETFVSRSSDPSYPRGVAKQPIAEPYNEIEH